MKIAFFSGVHSSFPPPPLLLPPDELLAFFFGLGVDGALVLLVLILEVGGGVISGLKSSDWDEMGEDNSISVSFRFILYRPLSSARLNRSLSVHSL